MSPTPGIRCLAEADPRRALGDALNHPPVAAASILGGDATQHHRQPYFYSDQYDLGMENTRHATPGGYDAVVIRGDVDKLEFIAFWTAQGARGHQRQHLGRHADDIRKAPIASGKPIERPHQLADPAVPSSA